ncbi:MAG TPA: cellulase family glycosylhydrolase [Rhizomicrobium sp.]|nr:cellulase family glycosylhydrolase [Rhizomicrobium sp.]
MNELKTPTAVRLVALVLLAVLALPFSQAHAQATNLFRRGVAIHDAMNWATMDKAKKTYVYPPFSDAKHPLTADELAEIRNDGFDFVRLTVDPGPFLAFQGAQLDGTYDILRQRVAMIRASDLAVIVDFHPVVQDQDYGPKALVAGSDTPLFNAYCAMLARTATVLAGFHSGHVALELMNEPVIGGAPAADAQWQTMEEKAYHAARGAAKDLRLVLQGDLAGDYDGLLALDPSPFVADQHTVFTFHFYLPYFFTNQSAIQNPYHRVAADVPYPALSRPADASINALQTRMKGWNETDDQKKADLQSATSQLAQYRKSAFDRSTIRGYFDQVAAWARTHKIPTNRILLGEFGVVRKYGQYDGARDSDRVRWLQDVREEAEQHGFSWSIWAYRGYGGMAIVDTDDTTKINPPTLKALGLR